MYNIIDYKNKKYKLVKSFDNKEILYPENLKNEIIDILEKSRKQETFLLVITGDTDSGKSWNETYDIKGKIGLSKGFDYYFPLMICFKEKYDNLNEKSLKSLRKIINNDNLNKYLNDGGSLILGNIIGIKNIFTNKELYKHPNFHTNYDFYNAKIKKENYNSVTIETNENTNESNKIESKYSKFNLIVKDKTNNKEFVYAKFDTNEEAKEFLTMSIENSFLNKKNIVNKELDKN